jgi:thiol-disulfide isomerase/thioredoxin
MVAHANRLVIQLLFAALCLVLLASCADWGPGGPGSALVDKPAPPFDLMTLGGRHFRLADHVGNHVVLLDMWATWCGPCRRELPTVLDVAREYSGRGLVVCAVNLQEDQQKVAAFAKAEKLNVPVALDEHGVVAQEYGANAIPMLVLIDKAGIVRFVHIGLRSNLKAELHSEIDGLLATRAAEAETSGSNKLN